MNDPKTSSPRLWSRRDNAKEPVVVADADTGWLVRLHPVPPDPVVVAPTFGVVALSTASRAGL